MKSHWIYRDFNGLDALFNSSKEQLYDCRFL